MSNDMPEEIYLTDSGYECDGCCAQIRETHPSFEPENGYTKYIRADLVSQWQSIETAPRDGTNFLFCTSGGHIGRGHFARHRLALGHKNGFRALDGFFAEPTHWMPLPQPPTEE